MVTIGRGRRSPSAAERRQIREGVSTSRALMSQHDKIWARYSRDKVDIGETLARILRTLAEAVPLDRRLRALSVGSSTEPQFAIPPRSAARSRRTSTGTGSRGEPRSFRTRITWWSIAVYGSGD